MRQKSVGLKETFSRVKTMMWLGCYGSKSSFFQLVILQAQKLLQNLKRTDPIYCSEIYLLISNTIAWRFSSQNQFINHNYEPKSFYKP